MAQRAASKKRDSECDRDSCQRETGAVDRDAITDQMPVAVRGVGVASWKASHQRMGRSESNEPESMTLLIRYAHTQPSKTDLNEANAYQKEKPVQNPKGF